ncbi:hypothetical protein Fcan01_23274 [Folsomia candida]|uniref:Uncharacterized protein n=1 Tax=Folsomia candida TaxID=158441 RepID=A0A226D9E2_FOLCA|nr:hypothetical protein Fcan01_23274 [Folsomia candida]
MSSSKRNGSPNISGRINLRAPTLNAMDAKVLVVWKLFNVAESVDVAIVTVSSGEIKFMMNGSMSALRAYLRGGPYATVICLDDATYLGVAGIPRVTIQVHKGEGLTRRLGPAKDDSFEVDIRMQLWNFSRALADDCDRYRLRKLLGTWVAEENDRPLNNRCDCPCEAHRGNPRFVPITPGRRFPSPPPRHRRRSPSPLPYPPPSRPRRRSPSPSPSRDPQPPPPPPPPTPVTPPPHYYDVVPNLPMTPESMRRTLGCDRNRY